MASVAQAVTTVTFPDANLEAAVRSALAKPTGAITDVDMQTLTTFNASNDSIVQLDGLQYATNLTSLTLDNNPIATITPVAQLTSLTHLSFDTCQVIDVTPLAGLTNLTYLDLFWNQLTDITPLAGLTNLATGGPGALLLNYNNLDLTDGKPAWTTISTLDPAGTWIWWAPQNYPSTTIHGIPTGWVNVDVSASLTATDNNGGNDPLTTYYALDGGSTTLYSPGTTLTVSAEGTTTISYFTHDSSDNGVGSASGETEPTRTATVLIDKTAPSVLGATTTLPNSAGWFNTPVTVHFTATDALSGVASISPDVLLSSDAASQTASGDATDVAGNNATATVSDINIDTQPPTTTDDHATTYTAGATISLSATDTLSGVAATNWSLDGVPGSGTLVTTSVLGNHALAYASTDFAGNTETTHNVTFAVVTAASEDIQGISRYDTAIAASRSSFATGSVTTVVLATGADFPDALSAGPLAGAYGSPVLLTMPNTLLTTVADEITRLGATDAVVVGGTGAVSSTVFDSLVTQLGVGHVSRLAGATRYGTAALVAERIKAVHPLDGTVFIATGLNYPDALAGGPDAWARVRPILLVNGSTVPTETLNEITSLAATRAVVLGGTGAVPDSAANAVQAQLVGQAPPVRLAGVTRYGTAAEVASWSAGGEGLAWTSCGIATGASFADALGGGPAMGSIGGPMMLTAPTTLPTETQTALTAHKSTLGLIRFFGGSGAISPAVRTAVMNALL